MSFECFLETLEHVPPECERNLTLIRELDERTCNTMDEINKLMDQYRKERKRCKRQMLRRKIMTAVDKTVCLADDKISLTLQTYETVDKNIRHMNTFSNKPVELPTGQVAKLGCEMPILEDEPTFCICGQVSHGEMIACENPDCPIEWFHLCCVKLKKAPKGKWFCDGCKKNL